ncbi:MAG: porin family protein [Dysgonamonadaceae bacterium]|jgi:hypothetical protein|nr:porin family protein [Dysgonamonadaceae bacterium]
MKSKIFVLVAALTMAVSASAQFSKGDVILSGQLSGLNFERSSFDEWSSVEFGLQASGGYFITDKFAVVGALGFASEKVDDADATSAFVFGIAPRYYVIPNLYGEVGYQALKATDVDLRNYIGVEVGYDYFINDKVFFEPAVYFRKGITKDVDETSNFGLSIGIGVKF